MRSIEHFDINSVAFHKAELHSERLRIFGVLSFSAVCILVTGFHVFVIHTATGRDPRLWGGSCLIFVELGFEYWTLRKVNWALQTESGLPVKFWIYSTILETSVPGWALAFLVSKEIDPIYRPVASPALLVFFILIIMSTLRLKPWISTISGVVASVSYLCAGWYLGWRPPFPGTPPSVAQSSVTLNAITLLLAGIVAGLITAQIRKHIQVALREAQTQRKLEAAQHDVQVARSIQKWLLPQEPAYIAGFQIAGWNQPADDTGGDYFDWERLTDGRLVISLADVTGQGIGPALLAAVCRAYARSSFRVSQDLPVALEHINQALGADLTTGRFATFVAAICCPRCPDIEILSAGHGPFIIYSRSQDQFTEMKAHGLPFGILPSFHPDPPTRLHLSG